MNKGEVTFPSLLVISGIISVKRKTGVENGAWGRGLIFSAETHYLHPKDCRAQCASVKQALCVFISGVLTPVPKQTAISCANRACSCPAMPGLSNFQDCIRTVNRASRMKSAGFLAVSFVKLCEPLR